MSILIKKLFVFILKTVALLVLVTTISAGVTVRDYTKTGKAITKDTSVFQKTGSITKQILIIGDSVSYGVGSSRPEYSFAGRLSERYPGYGVVNRSIVGAETEDISSGIGNLLDGEY